MNIGVDLDNVIADFQTTWLAYHNKHYGTNFLNKDVTVYDYSPIMGISSEEAMRRVYKFYDSPEFDNIKPEPGAVDAVPILSKKHKLYIITSRPDRTISRTNKWIDKYFDKMIEKIIHTNQFSAGHKGKVTKSAICKDFNITVMIEDAPKYAEEVAEAGISVILLDQAWNQNTHENVHIVRVSNWDEIVKEIEKLSRS